MNESYLQEIFIMIDRNTLLDDNELEKFMLLFMNSDFMKFIREKLSHTIKQNFKQTIKIEEQNNKENIIMVALIKAQC